jgi:hypothetical protein
VIVQPKYRFGTVLLAGTSTNHTRRGTGMILWCMVWYHLLDPSIIFFSFFIPKKIHPSYLLILYYPLSSIYHNQQQQTAAEKEKWEINAAKNPMRM